MGRAAGDGKHYRLAVVDVETMQPVGRFYDFVSVTTVIGKTLNKSGGMTGWAQNITAEGCIHLVKNKGLDLSQYDLDQLKGWLQAEGFTPYASRDKAADRGSAVHNILEQVAKAIQDDLETGKPYEDVLDPVLLAAGHLIDDLSEEEQGYCSAVINWIKSREPIPIRVEEPMVSFTHRVAGTFDLLWQTTKPIDEEYKTPAGRKVKHHLTLPVGITVLSDLKTSKAIYDSHEIQIPVYALMLEEQGEVVDAMTIVRVAEDGTFEEKEVTRGPEMFLKLLDVYRISEQ